ncbi:MAG: Glycerol-3-phosphate acyltransferase [bacterium ADurb.Bin431]|nr:MAG: Glycerol-3-phosphate acyltransferase [bacterium ADurb.Bin431]HNY89927.1 glycerol-3-phosphate 1-O-acyltransferase PlsY [bacterium]HOC23769.1 glycerol-3-phosphate 1-O-acyltransferase PlsY [bacterium]HOH06489.1 glycerol-3-phosphate 1-O-acyltransferase PlsY [bacterium]HOY44042.1 glycerol-3-phosphate 1-O-acyltransferase PlsY [bacterium]
MFTALIVLVLAYLLGSIPTSIIVGKVLRGIDIREHGSGNAGGTNTFRVLGWKPGLFVTLVDVFKGFVAAYWLPQWIAPQLADPHLLQLGAGIAAVFGHIWTVFAGFRGGKGVGTAAGMMLALFPEAVLYCLLIFGAILLATRIVSLSSISAAIAFPLILTIFRYVLGREVPLPFYLFSFFAAALIVYTHRTNVRRLLNGTENRFGQPKKK